MPQITAIEPQKKQKARYNIFIDGKFLASLDLETIIEYDLKIGKDLEQEQINKFLATKHETSLIDKALNFLSFRPRSTKEVRDYLIKKIAQKDNIKYLEAKEDPNIEKIIRKLEKYDYLNDAEFAKWWLESRKSRPKGTKLIRAELLKKGVDREEIEKVLSSITLELPLAQKALEKKIQRWQKLPYQELKKKVYQYLATRGFDYEIIRQAFAIYQKKR